MSSWLRVCAEMNGTKIHLDIGWRGTWMLGVHCDRLRGRCSARHLDGFGMFSAAAYDESTYREVTRASHLEMQQRPGAVARRVVGRFVETLESFGHYASDL